MGEGYLGTFIESFVGEWTVAVLGRGVAVVEAFQGERYVSRIRCCCCRMGGMYVAFVNVSSARVGWVATVCIRDVAITELVDYRYCSGKTTVSI